MKNISELSYIFHPNGAKLAPSSKTRALVTDTSELAVCQSNKQAQCCCQSRRRLNGGPSCCCCREGEAKSETQIAPTEPILLLQPFSTSLSLSLNLSLFLSDSGRAVRIEELSRQIEGKRGRGSMTRFPFGQPEGGYGFAITKPTNIPPTSFH